jgi:hypothetical protein
MGLVSGLVKAGIAKKAVDIARRPENQRKAKQFVSNLRGRKNAGR